MLNGLLSGHQLGQIRILSILGDPVIAQTVGSTKVGTLNGQLAGQQLGQIGLLTDPFNGQPDVPVVVPGGTHAQPVAPVLGVSQHHDYNQNTDPSTGLFYNVPGATHSQLTEALFLGQLIKQGFLFVTITHSGGVVQRMSNESLDGGTHYWEQSVKRLPSLSYESKPGGGYITVTWGKLAFFDGVFVDSSGQVASAPQSISVTLEWGWRDDRTKLIFEGQGMLRQIGESGSEYDLFEPEFKTLALEEGIGFSKTLQVSALSTDGTTLTITTGFDHGFNPGDEVILQRTSNLAEGTWSGRYTLTGTPAPNQFTVASTVLGTYTAVSLECSAEIVPLPLLLGSPGHPKLVRTGFGNEYRYYRPGVPQLLGAGLSLFDDGVDVTSTGWGTDSLASLYLERGTTQVFGQLTASGPRDLGDLQSLFVWGAERLGLVLDSFDAAIAASITLDHTVTTQGTLIDLLDQVAGYGGFAFYIQLGKLILFDRNQTHGNAGVLSDSELNEVSYNLPLPAKSWSASWSLRSPGRQRSDTAGSGEGVPVILETPKEVVLLGSNVLGQPKQAKVFSESEAQIRTRLKVNKAHQESTEALFTAPLERFPALGEHITYQDDYLSPPAEFNGKVWAVELNFDQELLTIKTKGGLV